NDIISTREGLLVGDIGAINVNGTIYDTAAEIEAYIASAANQNTFNFGNDTFTISLAETFEVTIADFGIGGVTDTLQLTNTSGLDLAGLLANSEIVNEAGHIKLVFDNGSIE